MSTSEKKVSVSKFGQCGQKRENRYNITEYERQMASYIDSNFLLKDEFAESFTTSIKHNYFGGTWFDIFFKTYRCKLGNVIFLRSHHN